MHCSFFFKGVKVIQNENIVFIKRKSGFVEQNQPNHLFKILPHILGVYIICSVNNVVKLLKHVSICVIILKSWLLCCSQLNAKHNIQMYGD